MTPELKAVMERLANLAREENRAGRSTDANSGDSQVRAVRGMTCQITIGDKDK